MNPTLIAIFGLVALLFSTPRVYAANPAATLSNGGQARPVSGTAASTSTTSLDVSPYTSFNYDGVVSGRFNALLQGWAVSNAHTTSADQSVRLRRAELKLSGAIANAPKYFFMIDPARLVPPPNGRSIPAENMLQDFGLTYAIVPGLEVSVGQFKVPTTAEGLDPAGDLPLPERSLVGRTFGDRREMGVRLAYRTARWNAATMVSSGRHVAVDGTGAFNDLDTRVEYTPTNNLGLGGYLVIGNQFDYSNKGRWGVNGRYNLGKAVLRAEYSRGKDGAVQSYGTTTELGYWVSENFEPIGRFETFSVNQSVESSAKAESIGVNYYLRPYLTKLQFSGTVMQDMAAVNGSPTYAKGVTNQELTLQLQTSI